MGARRPNPPPCSVDDYVLVRHSGSRRGIGECGGWILRGNPDLDVISSDMRRAGLRLHGRVGEERHSVIGKNPPCCSRESGRRIASRAADLRFGRMQACTYQLGNALHRYACIPTRVPRDLQRVGSTLRMPPGIRDDRYSIRHAHDAAHAAHFRNGAFVYISERALEYRTLQDGRVEHVRQPDIDRVDRPSGHLVGQVEPPTRGADQLPLARILQLYFFGHR
jgi:hypothetical protein